MSSRIFVFILAFAIVSSAFTYEFYDDFEDNDISDWEEQWGDGVWWASDGCLQGTVNYGPAGLVPVETIDVTDVTVSSYVKGVHAFGVAARIQEDSGILAYLSTDHNVARIRRLENGWVGEILTSVYVDFPSGVWYDVELTCAGEDLHFTIEIPSTDSHWELNAVDPYVQSGTVGLHMGTEPGTCWEYVSAEYTSLTSVDIHWLHTDDDAFGSSSGDGDAAFEPGEIIELAVDLQNSSASNMTGTYAVLQSLSPYLTVTDSYGDYGFIPAGELGQCSDCFGVEASSGTPPGTVADMKLTVLADGGFSDEIVFQLPVGCGISQDAESSSENWDMQTLEAGWNNEWHVSTARNHTAGGNSSYKCGDTGNGDYSDHLYCAVVSPLFNASYASSLSFWDWVDAQIVLSESSDALDGGLVQVGQFDTWFTIGTLSDYPYQIVSGSTGPFQSGTGVYSGLSDWTQHTLDIPDSLSGPLRMRFVFGSDDSGNREGWYIDDIMVNPSTGISEETPPSGSIAELSATPNPFHDRVEFTVLAASEYGTIEVFDLSGRIIQTVPYSSDDGQASVTWDGTSSSGRPVPVGVYFAREAGSSTDPVRLVRVR